ncbi:MAG TPA: hypothetical protein VEX68_29395 [Bryobacteraceae bacterium]|nr:hypothetical protein [Bryobacteraceae bacterium]
MKGDSADWLKDRGEKLYFDQDVDAPAAACLHVPPDDPCSLGRQVSACVGMRFRVGTKTIARKSVYVASGTGKAHNAGGKSKGMQGYYEVASPKLGKAGNATPSFGMHLGAQLTCCHAVSFIS